MADACFICGNETFARVNAVYRRCRACGHETLETSRAQAFIINDVLDAHKVRRWTALDRFQADTLERARAESASAGPHHLVDIGSGAGAFLWHNQGRFNRCTGIEITPASVNFSRNVLGLKIVADIGMVEGEIDVATAWHSLEHFPADDLRILLRRLGEKMIPGGVVIVSVPNASSFQYRIFRRHYAFFDVPSHLHQFTPDSLGRFFARVGFVPTRHMISWPYNVFGYTQALLNTIVPGHNYLYYRLKRGHPRASLARDLAAFCLLPFAALVGLGLSLIDAAFPMRQGVLTTCFVRRR